MGQIEMVGPSERSAYLGCIVDTRRRQLSLMFGTCPVVHTEALRATKWEKKSRSLLMPLSLMQVAGTETQH